MQTRKALWTKMGALCLAAALTLSVSAMAAEPKAETAQREDLDYLYSQLKTVHPDLFANTDEAAFLARKAEIEKRLPMENDLTFALALESLVALVQDSHTSLVFGKTTQQARIYPLAVDRFGETWHLSATEAANKALLGAEVTAINAMPMAEVLEAFREIISADNDVKLARSYSQMCNIADAYEYLGIAQAGEPLVLSLRESGGKTATLEIRAVEMATLQTMDVVTLAKLTTPPATYYNEKTDPSQYYFARTLDKDTYYIQYNTCREDPELPMDNFAKQVEQALDAGAYQRVIIDLRNNGGGSDGVIFPLLSVLRQRMDESGVELVGLIGEATFSSATINAVEIREMGGILVGEPEGGSVDHFGEVRAFELPNSGLTVQHSCKYIALSDLLESAVGFGVTALAPDVVVSQTLSDFLAGKDTTVEYLLRHKTPLSQKTYPELPLTRGRFLGMLYEAAGSPETSLEGYPFQDAFGIEWYLPAVAWGAQTGIVKGTAADAFSSAKPLTWQEAAVFAQRAVQVLKLEPKGGQRSADDLIYAPWTKAAVEQAVARGLLEEAPGDLSKVMTRRQGAILLQRLLMK